MSRLMRTISPRPLMLVGSHGPYLVAAGDGEAGRAYLDFFADVGTASLGYAGPEHEQAAQLMAAWRLGAHAPNLYPNIARETTSESLCRLTGMDKVFWCNSGSEAVEAAIKLARLYQWRKRIARQGDKSPDIWSYRGGFHGRTLAALAAGDGPPYHTDGFGPLPSGFVHFSIDDTRMPGPLAAACILAPVFGNNDVIPYPTDWLIELWEYCRKHDIILIFDEVQTGAGRTGNITYAQRIGIEPDIICMAKGIGMGAPVGLMLARGEVADTFTPGSHFSTFGGSPLSCAYVSVMLSWLQSPANLEAVENNGVIIRERLATLPGVTGVRGVGMLNAFDAAVDRVALESNALAEGLLLPTFRDGPGTVKVTPPLNIGSSDLEMGLACLERAYLKAMG